MCNVLVVLSRSKKYRLNSFLCFCSVSSCTMFSFSHFPPCLCLQNRARPIGRCSGPLPSHNRTHRQSELSVCRQRARLGSKTIVRGKCDEAVVKNLGKRVGSIKFYVSKSKTATSCMLGVCVCLTKSKPSDLILPAAPFPG